MTVAATTPTAIPDSGYPVRLAVDEAAPQNRLPVLLRLILLIPHAIIVGILAIIAFVIYFVSWIAILITGSYPASMQRFMIGFFRWSTRATGYYLLLTDKYPPFSMGTEGTYPIRLDIDERLENRNRLTTFWPIRALLAIPHLIIITILQYVMMVVVFIAWIIALITGSVPAGLHNFLAGYLRWYERTYAYVLLLNDEYPPFSLS